MWPDVGDLHPDGGDEVVELIHAPAVTRQFLPGNDVVGADGFELFISPFHLAQLYVQGERPAGHPDRLDVRQDELPRQGTLYQVGIPQFIVIVDLHDTGHDVIVGGTAGFIACQRAPGDADAFGRLFLGQPGHVAGMNEPFRELVSHGFHLLIKYNGFRSE